MLSLSELFSTRPEYWRTAYWKRFGIKRHISRHPKEDRSLEGQVVNGKTLTVSEARARRSALSGTINLSLETGHARVHILRDDIRRAVQSHERGTRVRAALKAGKLTQAWLSLATGIDKTQIGHLDTRDLRLSRALLVAKTLGVSVEDLWGE